MLAGTAIGVALSLADRAGVTDLTRLNPTALRDALAEEDQQTQYVRGAPDWSPELKAWTGLGSGVAIQKLIAAGWLSSSYAVDPYSGSHTIDPELPLTGHLGRSLASTLRTRQGSPAHLPWPRQVGDQVSQLSALGIRGSGKATVGDAYIWLALRLPRVTSVLLTASGAKP
jgi:hypothetical protein